MFIPLARFAVLLLAGTVTSVAFAQTPPPPAPVNHDFDFWLGEWTVTTPDNKPAGSSRIESIADGHGLWENWTGAPEAGGGNGESINAYNLGKKQWQQFWIGSGGGVLELAGGLVGGSMVLSGEHLVRGAQMNEKITWTPNSNGTVRQLWEQSPDGGKTWKAIFDGLYTKKK